MKPASHWINRAQHMYEIARNMSRRAHQSNLPPPLRARAEEACRKAVEAAGRFEEMALERHQMAGGD